MDLEYIPLDLKHLGFRFTPSTRYPLPKIKNPERLESWSIDKTFDYVAWLDLVDIPVDGSLVVFSNLKSLSLRVLNYFWFDFGYDQTWYDFPERLIPAQGLQVLFPKLANPEIIKKNPQAR